MDASPPLSIPRLRLPRHSPHLAEEALTPVAGPSHNPNLLHADDDEDEDAESTPRMSSSAIDKHSPRVAAIPGLPTDNPTARLRALLSRVPNSPPNGNTPHASGSRPLIIPSGSEPESDFEPPHSIASASSFARESLKELFSHALRDPGNTPRKHGRPRRNSIDASEVEASPRVEVERASYKAKRRSLSDEEADKSRNLSTSGRSLHISATSKFDALRQRLNRSSSVMPSLPQEQQMVMDMSMPPPNSSTDTAMVPPFQMNIPSDTPPRATSTPMRTFQMSKHLDMQSNLLDQDSEMQNALQGMDSYESAPVPRHRYNSTPSLKQSAGPTPRPHAHAGSHARPLSWNSHSASHSINNLPPVRRASEDLDSSSSRASSSLSGADYHERQGETQHERLHERERGWNSPVPKTPKSPHPGQHHLTHHHSSGSLSSGRASPAHRLSRKDSAASLASTDDGRSSSRASSVTSRSEYKERMKEFEEERHKEREHGWNKRHPELPEHKLHRSSSSLSLNKSDRVRTISTPSRPDSATSYLSPVQPTLHRHGSSNSLSSSRPVSPVGSISDMSIEVEAEHEFEHLRERNWNSPRPDWHLHHRRSLSPLPSSRPGSPTGSPAHTHMHSTTPRSRSNSITHDHTLSVPSPIPRSKSPMGDPITRAKSPSFRSSVASKPTPSPHVHVRPKSPAPPTPSPDKAEKAEAPQGNFRSRFGWSFPKADLPPLELDHESPARPRPPSRSSLSAGVKILSHIPVKSPKKNDHTSTSSVASVAEKKRSHRRSVTEFTESIGAIPPRIEVSSIDDLPPVPIVDKYDEFSSSSASEDDAKVLTSTPTAKPILLPSETFSTPASQPAADAPYNGHELQAPETQQRPDSPLASPPLTPPSADSQPMFNLQTTPKRPQFQTPKTEFETPPPPRGMPDLPGPPTSDEEIQDDHTTSIQNQNILAGNLTAMKTPRPPGAWLATPAPTRQFIKEPTEGSSSVPPPPDFNSSTSSDSGLATPPSTLSRASTLPLQTPAPPGGWVATPAPAISARRRGSILKVRFDIASETASEGTVEKTNGDDGLEAKMQRPHNGDAGGPSANGDASAASSAAFDASVGPTSTPPSLRDRIRQKSPGIRVLDAYGREHVEPEVIPEAHFETVAELVAQHGPTSPRSSTPRKDARLTAAATPRNRSAVRLVDAMGREVEEPAVEEGSTVSQAPLSHNEAIIRLRAQVSSMAHDLSDADRSIDSPDFDERMYAALQEQCKAAQLARGKISKSLQLAQSTSTELELKSKFAPSQDQAAVKSRGAVSPIGGAGASITWNLLSWRVIAGFVFLQLLLLIIMYRYSMIQARRIFLTTYYDAFYPELYIYLFKLDTTSNSIPPCASWSISNIFSSLQRASWRGVTSEAGCALSSFLQPTWFGYTHNTAAHSWPPT